MAFDQTTRNRLARFVGDSRALMTEEFTRQLQHEYGIDATTGEVTNLERLNHLDDARRETAQILRDTLAHYMAGQATQTDEDRREAIERIIREQAFTVLNRLAALRMMEARGLLLESVAEGYQSRGFQLYNRLAGTALGETGDTYRSYLFSLFDEFAVDLPVLFDRFSSEGRLFPHNATLLQMLDELNHADIDPLWAEDETIGWIYQYFNSREERKQMRDESSAPRNSRELAVRNQFFTPRYVVEFLTDNTLGRTWYEMTQGETALKESCRYLVQPPNEIFLAPGESAQEGTGTDKDFSQEKLLNQPVHIPHRPLKDPRDLKMLDPACGSMHFGLYAFDLYEDIYAEAWALEESRGPDTFSRPVGFKPLQKIYADKADFQRDVPRLIIENNIHGIDIDPRAVQIAGLSLWLRAQRSWQKLDIKPQDRPTVSRSNIVTAEPMPGNKNELNEFIAQHLSNTAEESLLGQLLRRVFEAMELAGEAGSLLKIDEEIAYDIAEAKDKWFAKPESKQLGFFEETMSKQEQYPETLDVSGITDASFWERAEQRIYRALQEYSEQAENGNSYSRRLFAEDAVRGFAFIDLCQRQFDIVLMNPPYGSHAKLSRNYLQKSFHHSSQDIYSCFYQRAIGFLHNRGLLGALTSRTFLTFSSFRSLRNYILGISRINSVADLGHGVLDDAAVETCAIAIEKTEIRSPSIFYRLLKVDNKADALLSCIDDSRSKFQYVRCQEDFSDIPGSPISYWAGEELRKAFQELPSFEEDGGIPTLGLVSADNERFVRLRWEIQRDHDRRRWPDYCKGGDYSKYYDDPHLIVDWRYDGKHIQETFGDAVRLRDIGNYFLGGLNYPLVTNLGMNVRIMPKESIFDNTAPAILTSKTDRLWLYLAVTNTRAFEYFARLLTSSRHWQVGYLRKVPFPHFDDEVQQRIELLIRRSFDIRREWDQFVETSHLFKYPLTFMSLDRTESLTNSLCHLLADWENRAVQVHQMAQEIDLLVLRAYGLDDNFIDHLNDELSYNAITYSFRGIKPDPEEDLPSLDSLFTLSPAISASASEISRARQALPEESRYNYSRYVADLISHLLGFLFARWDIRILPNSDLLPDPSSAFDPLPVCAPAMLVNTEGLPATSNNIASDEWLGLRSKGISESLKASVVQPIISDFEYPLDVKWDGILVDDVSHSDDIIRGLRAVLKHLWAERSDIIEQEICDILNVKDLRNYFRKPGNRGFWGDHFKRYSKSRRFAPIYWPITTSSGSYTLWLYYHRIDDQILYTCVNDFVDPKLKDLSGQIRILRLKPKRSKAQEDDLARLIDLETELNELRSELLRTAAFWQPKLEDGAQISAAPLWRLFQHPQWQNKLKDTWKRLEAGDYDWAHLAMSIWPERVVPKCVSDRSLAIAHDLEGLFWVEDEGSWRLLQTQDQEIDELLERRQTDNNERLRQHLETLASGAGKGVPAFQVWRHLSEGNWDDTSAALALWPDRVGEKHWDNPLMASQMGLNMPAKRTKTNRKRFLKRILDEGAPELAKAVASAFQDEDEAFDVVWRSLASGERDDQPLALALWPERVVNKCVADVDMALNHDLQRYFWCRPASGKWRRRKPQDQETKQKIARRQAGAGG